MRHIPKVIHYCWFGGKEKPPLVKKCIESWHQYCPDYEIKEWNETNFDVDCIPYVAAAYADKKWAFVSDYARLYLVYEYGGVYLDTDVLLKSNCLDEWCEYPCWLASDNIRYIATGLGFGAEKGNLIIKAMMDAYCNYTYPNGTNVSRDTLILEQQLPAWVKSDHTQTVDQVLIVGCADYGKYANHLYAYSWSDDADKQKKDIPPQLSRKEQRKVDFKWELRRKLCAPAIIAYMDQRKGSAIEKLYTFFCYDLMDFGLKYYLKKIIHKIFK